MATVKRHYHDVARSSSGGVIGSPTVTVYEAGTTTVSTIFSDGSGTAKSNPFTGESDGFFEFWVDPGDYKVRVERTGYEAFEADNVEIGYDHSELAGLATGDPHTQYAALAGRVAGQELNLGAQRSPTRSLDVVGQVIIDPEAQGGALTHGAPLYITADQQTAPGGNACGIQIEISANPAAGAGSPGVGDYVIGKFSIDNLGRGELWGLNIIALQVGAGEHGSVRGMEVEVGATSASTQLTDPFGPRGATESRVNGIEIVAHEGSTARPAAALTSWANDTTGDGWWYNGIALSRVFQYGLRLVRNPGGASDAIEPFQGAAIFDESNSASVVKVNGTHGSVIDLSGGPTLTRFLLGKASAATDLLLGNNASQDIGISLESGASGGGTAHLAYLRLKDRGTAMWDLRKEASANNFQLYNWTLGASAISALNASNFVGLGTDTPLRQLHMQSANPTFLFYESDAAADSKAYLWSVSGGTLFCSVRNDADSAGATYLRVTRTGTTINEIALAEGTNLSLFASTGSYGGGSKVLFLGNATTDPSSTPTGGSVLYSSSARAKVREDASRFLVQAVAATKTTAGAPYANDGYVEMVVNGTTLRLMTTAG